MRRILAAASLLVLCSTAPVASQEAGDANRTAKSIYNLTSATFDNLVHSVFVPTMEAQGYGKVGLFKSITLNSTNTARPGARAYIKGSQRLIDVSLGNSLAVFLYSEYAVLINGPYPINAECNTYIKYLKQQYRTYPDDTIDAFLTHTLSPADYCGVNTVRQDADFQKQYTEMIMQTIIPTTGIIVGHEYAHHLLGHLDEKSPSSARSRLIEAEADRFASNLLFNRIIRAPSAIIFDLISAARPPHEYTNEARHDVAECRLIYFLLDDRRFFAESSFNEILAGLSKRKDITSSLSRSVKEIAFIKQANKTFGCHNISTDLQ